MEKFRIWNNYNFGRGKSWPGCVELAVPAVYVFYVCGQITSPKVGRYVHDVMKYGHCSAVMYTYAMAMLPGTYGNITLVMS